MRKIWIVIVACILLGCLVVPAASAKNDDTPTATPTPEPTQKLEKITVDDVTYEPIELLSKDIIKAARQFLGFEPKDTAFAVTKNAKVLGTIQTDSKFKGMAITDYCLQFQYGTDK